MDNMAAFAMGDANRGRELKVFDWARAAQRIKETGAKEARAGLAGDWEYTCGPILADGMPVPEDETYVCLASTWATPELELDGMREDCHKMQSETPGWHAGTYWPMEAREILGQEVNGTFEVVNEQKLLN